MYGALNWFDVSAAACGEMVFDLVRELGVPLTHEIATHVYIAILTDTGSFHYSNISPRTFDICRQCIEAGVESAGGGAQHLRQQQPRPAEAVRRRAQPDGARRDRPPRDACPSTSSSRADCGGTYEDTEGLINLPLTVKEIQARRVLQGDRRRDDWRVSMRSKGDVDINAVAKEFGGGGHKNASGCSATGTLEELKALFQQKILEQIDRRRGAGRSW